MNLLEPWILFRLVAGLVAAALFVRAAWVGTRVLKYFHLRSTAEGQLALERQIELAATSARVGAVIQVGALWLSIVAADRLTATIRGAMCGYGVVHANAYGAPSIVATIAAALAAGVELQVLALDRATRSLALVRPLAYFAIGLAALSLVDLSLSGWWLGTLDMSVVASCCSTGIDAAASALERGHTAGPRVLVAIAAAVLVPLATIAALVASRRAKRGSVALSGALAAFALPVGVAAIILEVAPYVYEVPHHRCPYCLFKADALYLGYPLFAAAFLAFVWGVGAGVAALLAKADGVAEPFAPFARRLLRREAVAWALAFALAAAPIVRYAIVAPGASLFR